MGQTPRSTERILVIIITPMVVVSLVTYIQISSVQFSDSIYFSRKSN